MFCLLLKIEQLMENFIVSFMQRVVISKVFEHKYEEEKKSNLLMSDESAF